MRNKLLLLLSLSCLNFLTAFRYEEPCVYIEDSSTHERFIQINGHTFIISELIHEPNCEGCQNKG